MLVLSFTAPPANTGSRPMGLHVHGAQLPRRLVDKHLMRDSWSTALSGRFYHCNTAQCDGPPEHLRQRVFDGWAELCLDLLPVQLGARLHGEGVPLQADGRA